ncbi:MAG: F0F1 ATP synthase subunit epsilon [Deltaproteobacteria bacterium]
MRLQIVTPDRAVLDCEVEEVYAPGTNGEFGILPEHITFLSSLDVGALRYRIAGKDEFVAVSGGVTEVLDDSVTVLADTAEKSAAIDIERAKVAATAAEAAMEKHELGSIEYEEAAAALRRAQNRTAVAAL